MNVDYKKYSHSLIFLTFAGILLSNISCKDSIVDPIVKHNKIVYLTDKDGTVGIISTNYINHQIFVMDLDGMNQNNISLSPDTDFVSIDYAPLTKKLLSRHVTINASYYYTMNLDGTQKKIITSTFQNNFGARFTPDGKNIVYSSFGTHSDIFKVDIDGISRIN